MNILIISQIIGTIAVFFLFIIQFWMSINETSFQKSGRVILLWTSTYIFFLFVLRVFTLFKIATLDDLRIVSGFSALIPLVAVIIHLLIVKKIEETPEI